MPLWLVAAALALSSAACADWSPAPEQVRASKLEARSRWGTSSVFTPARPSLGEAAAVHFGLRGDPEQPIAYSHRVHLAQEMVCTDCHEAVERGPRAGLPGLDLCMTCHSAIATDKPAIQAMAERHGKGLDVEWQRVYDYPREAHVRFAHAPHIAAKVDCATCHGDMRQQEVARRVVDMNMAFCVNCHTAKQASNDCLTCHY